MKRNIEEYIDIVDNTPQFEEYQFYEALKERKIILNREIDFSLVERAIFQIIKWNEEDNVLPIEERTPIKIYIYSNGGDVISGLGLIDVIKSSITPVHIICVGLAASMAAYILVVGHKRFAYKNSTILLHDGSLSLSNTAKKAKQTIAYYDELEDRLKNIILTHTKITEEMYDEKNGDEWYIFGDQALNLGIIDELL